MQAKTHILNALRRRTLSKDHKCCIQLKTDDLEKLEELASLESQVKALRLQDKLGKRNFQEDMKKVFQPVTKTNKDTSRDKTKTMMETSTENNKTLENLNNKLLEGMTDRGIIASYLLSPSSKITNPEHISQFKLVKHPSSNRVNDLLLNKTITVTLYNSLTFRDTDKKFELQGDLLKMITNKNYRDLPKLSDKKMYDSLKEMIFDKKL